MYQTVDPSFIFISKNLFLYIIDFMIITENDLLRLTLRSQVVFKRRLLGFKSL